MAVLQLEGTPPSEEKCEESAVICEVILIFGTNYMLSSLGLSYSLALTMVVCL
jgi:hypothetical protein